jgi:hypothetical protein
MLRGEESEDDKTAIDHQGMSKKLDLQPSCKAKRTAAASFQVG